MTMIIIAGVVGMCLILLYLNSQLDENRHWLFKLLIIFFVMSSLLLIPKTLYDSKTICETVVSNSTDVSSTITSYEYEKFCYERPELSTYGFLRISNFLYWLFWGYTIVYIAIWAIKKMNDSWRGP